MKTILSLVFIALLISCNTKEENKRKIDTAAPDAAAIMRGKSCYQHINGRDTVVMAIVMSANNANGELVYKLDGKDKNDGTFSGTFIGDTLYADYTFNSEGTKSVRETVFLRRKDALIQGFGEMTESGNRQSFIDPKKVKFDESLVLRKKDCR